MNNVNNSYFQGLYKEIWRATVPEQVTEKEVKFLKEYFGLQPASHVLDLMCGYGRHAIGLARSGITVTAVDNLPDYIEEIAETAERDRLDIHTVSADLLTVDLSGSFDLAICMGNSLNFFPESDIRHILKKVSQQLIVGGSLLINTWSLIEIVAKGIFDKQWSRYEDMLLLSESQYKFQPTRIETVTTIIKNNVTAETKLAIDYIFSVSELIVMLEESGFHYRTNFSIPGRTEFKIGDPRAYIVADKVS